MENKRAHLQMIQAVINRMAGNAFLLKGWSVVLVSALIALAATASKVQFVLVALLPAVAFWLLDGYFLRQERLFRRLYDSVCQLDEAQIDFSMDTTGVSSGAPSVLRTALSTTVVLYHGAILLAVVAVAVYCRLVP